METSSTTWDVNYFSKKQTLDSTCFASLSIKFRGIERCIIQDRNGRVILVKRKVVQEKEVESVIPSFFLAGEETCNKYVANVLSKARICSWIQHRIVTKISKDAIYMSHLLGEEEEEYGFSIEAEVEVVKEIVVLSFNDDNELEGHRHDDCCTICIEELLWDGTGERKKIMTLRCSHKFHEDCILKWLDRKDTCPICRENILSS
ncbi:hypothetical protein CARUB_v10027994mg [Capsella rubella]|uniref:RING-type domain-containing protein n=1 Tax=Capsella rubella TaxID=81985 RepID=R0EV48_9BRAS|nr:probable E3 ubiquitin-protein ligase ZFP1 [Capsella rubella]EOA12701.1 hypothetical protein CARUB_v10027994mg [Capsella rubella]